MALLAVQCRAARSLLDWSQSDLAKASDVAMKAVVDFERGQRVPHVQMLAVLRKTLQDAGILFVEANLDGGPGARLAKDRSVEAHTEMMKTLDDEHADLDHGRSPQRALNRMKAAIANDDHKKLTTNG